MSFIAYTYDVPIHFISRFTSLCLHRMQNEEKTIIIGWYAMLMLCITFVCSCVCNIFIINLNLNDNEMHCFMYAVFILIFAITIK